METGKQDSYWGSGDSYTKAQKGKGGNTGFIEPWAVYDDGVSYGCYGADWKQADGSGTGVLSVVTCNRCVQRLAGSFLGNRQLRI